jgi:hypothetical protein
VLNDRKSFCTSFKLRDAAPRRPSNCSGARSGDFSGYLRDVELAWADSEKSEDVGRQSRYALIVASVNGFAHNVTPPLLEALLRLDLWSVDTAWAYVRRVRAPDKHISLLVSLACWLNSEDRLRAAREGLEILKQAPPHEQRARMLASIAALFDEDLVNEALAIEWDDTQFKQKEIRAVLSIRKVQLGQCAAMLEEAKGLSEDYLKMKLLRRQRTERRLKNQSFMEPSKRPLTGKRKKTFIRSLFSKDAG